MSDIVKGMTVWSVRWQNNVLQTCAGKCDQIKDCVLCVGFKTGPLKDQIDENGLCPGKCNDTIAVDELDSKQSSRCVLGVSVIVLSCIVKD